MSDVTRRTRCRLCEGARLQLVLPIAPSPIADAYVPADRLGERQDAYPLDLYLCHDCGHVQNIDVVHPEILFRDYIYTTSTSLGLVEHYRRYADEVAQTFAPKADSLVVEIGSNDGSLLRFFREKGLRVLGVDPARRIAEEATAKGLPTIPDFFTQRLAERIVAEHGHAAIVAANNVFAHADDLADIVRGVRTVLAPDGVFVFEVSYLPDIVDRFLFDTVYHEHVSYHSIRPLHLFFERLGLTLFDVQRIASKGGSIRGFAQPSSTGRRPTRAVVGEMLRMEAARGFDKAAIYANFGEAIEERKRHVNARVDELRKAGNVVAGYGASTTVTTLMWHFGLQDKLAFLVDDNPKKQGLYAPRSHIPVLASDALYSRKPAAVVVLAWQYAEPIVQRHQRYLQDGGRFLIPLPEPKLL